MSIMMCPFFCIPALFRQWQLESERKGRGEKGDDMQQSARGCYGRDSASILGKSTAQYYCAFIYFSLRITFFCAQQIQFMIYCKQEDLSMFQQMTKSVIRLHSNDWSIYKKLESSSIKAKEEILWHCYKAPQTGEDCVDRWVNKT